MIFRWLRSIAWPSFDCEDCIGMAEHGCYCSAVGAIAPCTPPHWWHKILQHVLAQTKEGEG